MTAFTIVGLVAGYLVVGLLCGALTSRIFYRRDSYARNALDQARRKPNGYYEDIYGSRRTNVNVALERLGSSRNTAIGWGTAVMFFWPVAIAGSAVVAVIGGLAYVAVRGLTKALTPGDYDSEIRTLEKSA